MQSNLIFLAFIAGCSAFTVIPRQPSNETIPTYWKMEVTDSLHVGVDTLMKGQMITDQGKNYVQLEDGSRVPIILEPVGTNESIHAVNKDFGIRIRLPMKFGYERKHLVGRRLKNGVEDKVEVDRFKVNPYHTFVYTSGDFSADDLWEIDVSKKIEYLKDSKKYIIVFSIHRIFD